VVLIACVCVIASRSSKPFFAMDIDTLLDKPPPATPGGVSSPHGPTWGTHPSYPFYYQPMPPPTSQHISPVASPPFAPTPQGNFAYNFPAPTGASVSVPQNNIPYMTSVPSQLPPEAGGGLFSNFPTVQATPLPHDSSSNPPAPQDNLTYVPSLSPEAAAGTSLPISPVEAAQDNSITIQARGSTSSDQ
jgi:hypothetical protein